ncbi:BMP family ABC transporter substrate-binding protein [Kocuria rhizophila]|nr:BMP family ABC transporter substrate-binding protein [Kocuria rhizophila]
MASSSRTPPEFRRRPDPDKRFAIVDDNSIKADNVKPIVYDTAEAAFLAGYLAAGSSRPARWPPTGAWTSPP